MRKNTQKDLNDALKRRHPDAWAALICIRISRPMLRNWIGCVILWTYPDDRAWASDLLQFEKPYQANRNWFQNLQLKRAFDLLDLPWVDFESGEGDSLPRLNSRGSIHDKFVYSQHLRHPEAYKYIIYHSDETSA